MSVVVCLSLKMEQQMERRIRVHKQTHRMLLMPMTPTFLTLQTMLCSIRMRFAKRI